MAQITRSAGMYSGFSSTDHERKVCDETRMMNKVELSFEKSATTCETLRVNDFYIGIHTWRCSAYEDRLRVSSRLLKLRCYISLGLSHSTECSEIFPMPSKWLLTRDFSSLRAHEILKSK